MDIAPSTLTTTLNNLYEIYANTPMRVFSFLIVNQNLTFTYDSMTN